MKYYEMSNAERHAYDEHINAIMIQNDVLGNARMEGHAEGKAEGRTEGIGDSIKALMGNVKCTLEQAMDMLGIAVDSRDIYRKMLQNNK